MRVFVVLIITYLFLPTIGFGQGDSVRVLNEVEVVSSPWEKFVPAHKKYQSDSLTTQLVPYQSVSARLMYISPVHIRSYGVSGLTTISQRGFGGSRTKVLWNGMDLQSLSNGSMDIGQLPAFFFDNMALYSGGQSAVAGSAAIGGILDLEPLSAKPNFRNQSRIFLRAGSFESYSAGVKTSLSKGKHSGSVKLFYHQADNDYSFENTYKKGSPEQRMEHSGRQNGSVAADYLFRLSNPLSISAAYWGLYSDSELPSLASQSKLSEEEQEDTYHRGIVNFMVRKSNYDLDFSSGIDIQNILYRDGSTDLESKTKSFRWQNSASYAHYFEKFTLNLSAKGNREEVTFNNTGAPVKRRRLTGEVLGSVRYEPSSKAVITAGLNQTLVEGVKVPLTPSISGSFHLNRILLVKGEASRIFRVPTFNDLYWEGSGARGNPDLKPESGISGSVGTNLNVISNRKTSTTFSIDLYSATLNSQIIWSPAEDGAWTPQNLQKVWSRGVEMESLTKVDGNEVDFMIRLNYQLTRASLMEDSTIAEEYTGKQNQLFYTPEHVFGGNISAVYKAWTLAVFNQYSGKQFTTLDNNQRWVLDGWFLSDLNLSYTMKINDHALTFSGEVKNVFDTAYEVRRERIMPGRNYSFSINFLINH
ncbi:TonB-dependent receptor plug domain-containing protein [Marinigracilibium pacificum]|uniref:TonB-dependent receptor n=1 Tax=Marinigracilibium pacificum TaxID=2729599 RepID=A0A848J1E5_9BACT|nr:TonB-dependent receptor [Marinigracilibium pacificum]NMM49501.1 TonB-dependent receptor [Marinigracilibium pacificum]